MMAETREPVRVSVNVMRARLTILGFNLAIITFQINELPEMAGGVKLPGIGQEIYLSAAAALFMGLALSIIAMVSFIASCTIDREGVCNHWSLLAGDLLMYLALAQTVVGFFGAFHSEFEPVALPDPEQARMFALTSGAMKVARIRRGDTFIMPLPDVVLREGDRLRVRDTPANLKSYEEALSATLYGDEHVIDERHPLQADDQIAVEIAVVPGSTLDRTSLRYARFIARFQLAVLALHRPGKEILKADQEIQDVRLTPGDVLLVQGPRDQISELKRGAEFLVLDSSMVLPRTRKAPIALAIIALVVLTAALGIMPIAVSAAAGACLMLVLRCMSIGAAIRAISPSVFFVVAASLALGAALVDTGATGYLTDLFLALTAGRSPTVILGSLMLMLAVLTNVVSNNAAAVIGTPIAIGIAQGLALPAEPFVLAVLFGANLSYATPMAYKTNLLVMSAGNYTFTDFLKVGVPLSIIMWLVLTALLSWLYL